MDYTIIEILKANRYQKPIFINNDIFNGTYRRNYEGDYHCTRDEIQSMIRDQLNESYDTKVLNYLTMTCFNEDTIKGYRNRLASYKPGHVFNKLNTEQFLEAIGAAVYDNQTHQYCPTAAGLLMFGNEYQIVREFPNYFLDYQEHYDPSLRWSDRIISSSGEWSGNLIDFYFSVYNKLSLDIKKPFYIMEDGLSRIDDTPVHKALREVLVNALSNANFYERQGIVIKKYTQYITVENPGSIRISREQMLKGGISDPRNAMILKMFNMINIGERAGSGIPNIFDVWDEKGWIQPEILETFQPERTKFILSFKKVKEKKATEKSDRKKATEKSDRKKVAEKKEYSLITQKSLNLIIYSLKENELYSFKDIMMLTGLKKTRTRELLLMLINEGLIEVQGKGRSTKYLLKSKE